MVSPDPDTAQAYVEMPEYFQILSAQFLIEPEPGIYIWALVNPRMPLAMQRIYVIPTGMEIDKSFEHFIGTVFCPAEEQLVVKPSPSYHVFHLFI